MNEINKPIKITYNSFLAKLLLIIFIMRNNKTKISANIAAAVCERIIDENIIVIKI